MSGKVKVFIIGVVFDADSRGGLRFHPFYGLRVVYVTIEYTAAQGQ